MVFGGVEVGVSFDVFKHLIALLLKMGWHGVEDIGEEVADGGFLQLFGLFKRNQELFADLGFECIFLRLVPEALLL